MLDDVDRFANGPALAVAAAAVVGAAVCAVAVARRGRTQDRSAVPPEAGLAWLRAGTYFCVCLIVAWLTGTLSTVGSAVVRDPPSAGGRWAFALACVAVELVAYWVIWPRGTYTLDRPLDLRWQLPFGLAWGVCQGLVFLSFQHVITEFSGSDVIAGLATFVAIAMFQGLWHGLYWDKFIAPDHNDPAWNLPKVLCCHVPNLAVTVTYLFVVGNEIAFVGFQTIALVGSTIFMRFPRFPRHPATQRA